MSKRFDCVDVTLFEPATVMNRFVVDRRIQRDRAEVECRVNSVDGDEMVVLANDEGDFVADWELEVDELLADDEEEILANENENVIGD